MPRFPNLFRSRQSPRNNAATTTTTTSNRPAVREPASRDRDQRHQSVISDQPDHIRNYVDEKRKQVQEQIRELQSLTQDERSTIIVQITKIKRELKTAHRDLEQFLVKNSSGLGKDEETLVRNATRDAWRAYMSVVKLEERLRGLKSRGSVSMSLEGDQDMQARHGWEEGYSGKVDHWEDKMNIPTGAWDVKKESPTSLSSRRTFQESEPDEDVFLMSGALPIEDNDGIAGTAHEEPVRDPLSVLRDLPRILNRGALSESTPSLGTYQTNPEQIPQPREEVKRRIQQEESSLNIGLHEPDRVRRGSCNGFVITEMTMKGLEDTRFVQPYLHYMKLHELRYLKEWLADAGHITRSGPISRMEKALHCIQLLQTGCRYEALAVIFSRSPRQIKEACQEVIRGVLQWHKETVLDDEEQGEQTAYISLWGIWNKYVVTNGKAGLYYGFGWTQMGKVLVALNLYIGRWRMQGQFAMEGPAFVWGKFFVSEGDGHVPERVKVDEIAGQCKDNAWLDDDSNSAIASSNAMNGQEMPRQAREGTKWAGAGTVVIN
ncbi:hypothetical protein EJ02DRAFT_85850 [Clathrospora elynae]|uniref:Uncharacterized protein n=1 Tax=Clathrospora elynae TaxID=706981 RepID=A0A6A5SZB0_9PLEO|nr:hypothetical protein EJ02DRAFT_85850 [Clathrospora elynae]